MAFTIKVNGTDHQVDVDGDTPLLWVLRDVLGMTGTKFGCGAALCGACTVHIAGVATRSCISWLATIWQARPDFSSTACERRKPIRRPMTMPPASGCGR